MVDGDIDCCGGGGDPDCKEDDAKDYFRGGSVSDRDRGDNEYGGDGNDGKDDVGDGCLLPSHPAILPSNLTNTLDGQGLMPSPNSYKLVACVHRV